MKKIENMKLKSKLKWNINKELFNKEFLLNTIIKISISFCIFLISFLLIYISPNPKNKDMWINFGYKWIIIILLCFFSWKVVTLLDDYNKWYSKTTLLLLVVIFSILSITWFANIDISSLESKLRIVYYFAPGLVVTFLSKFIYMFSKIREEPIYIKKYLVYSQVSRLLLSISLICIAVISLSYLDSRIYKTPFNIREPMMIWLIAIAPITFIGWIITNIFLYKRKIYKKINIKYNARIIIAPLFLSVTLWFLTSTSIEWKGLTWLYILLMLFSVAISVVYTILAKGELSSKHIGVMIYGLSLSFIWLSMFFFDKIPQFDISKTTTTSFSAIATSAILVTIILNPVEMSKLQRGAFISMLMELMLAMVIEWFLFFTSIPLPKYVDTFLYIIFAFAPITFLFSGIYSFIKVQYKIVRNLTKIKKAENKTNERMVKDEK